MEADAFRLGPLGCEINDLKVTDWLPWQRVSPFDKDRAKVKSQFDV